MKVFLLFICVLLGSPIKGPRRRSSPPNDPGPQLCPRGHTHHCSLSLALCTISKGRRKMVSVPPPPSPSPSRTSATGSSSGSGLSLTPCSPLALSPFDGIASVALTTPPCHMSTAVPSNFQNTSTVCLLLPSLPPLLWSRPPLCLIRMTVHPPI